MMGERLVKEGKGRAGVYARSARPGLLVGRGRTFAGSNGLKESCRCATVRVKLFWAGSVGRKRGKILLGRSALY